MNHVEEYGCNIYVGDPTLIDLFMDSINYIAGYARLTKRLKCTRFLGITTNDEAHVILFSSDIEIPTILGLIEKCTISTAYILLIF